MKKLFILTVILLSVSLFISCEKDPKPTPPEGPEGPTTGATPPTIILPTDATTLVIHLGDSATVMKDVTARDDEDGWITSSIKLVSDLDVVGETELEYEVTNSAGKKTTAKRKVIIRSGKLAGNYWVNYASGYEMLATEENISICNVVLNQFHMTLRAVCVPDGKGKLKIQEFTEGNYTYNGSVMYEKVGSAYKIVAMKYNRKHVDTGAQEEFDVTCSE